MSLRLGQLRIGKVDGKHEYLTPASERERTTFDAFLVPDAIDPTRMNNGDIFFVSGFRGTGKTSLLRWHAEQQRTAGAETDIILFKSDLTESERLHISKEVGISWADFDSKSTEISQDFKDAWAWFTLHKIGENLKQDPTLYKDEERVVPKILRLLGLQDDNVFQKAIGFMPKLEGAQIKIRADVKFFEAELEGDFKPTGEIGTTTLSALSRSILSKIKSINFTKPIYIYFDELETFYHTPEQHRRDQRMVRDLLFSVAKLNDSFRESRKPLHILAAVRSEVIGAMGSLGQEVDRLVHDRGFIISWHHANRSLKHPLVRMIGKKINASEKAADTPVSTNPIEIYFPKTINGEQLDEFILDRSFYKPRDIIWRLTIAQQLFPNEVAFSDHVLRETEVDYSNKLWDEVRYELGATYSDEQVDAIESVFSGGAEAFELRDIERRFGDAAEHSRTLTDLLARRSVRDILNDLYRLGAIGNSFRAGTSGTSIRNRWAFRGEPRLLVERRMVVHPALVKRLSVVSMRRRGKRGGTRLR